MDSSRSRRTPRNPGWPQISDRLRNYDRLDSQCLVVAVALASSLNSVSVVEESQSYPQYSEQYAPNVSVNPNQLLYGLSVAPASTYPVEPTRNEAQLPLSGGQVIAHPMSAASASSGSRPNDCPYCRARHSRPVRYRACANRFFGIKPYACGGKCGDYTWCVVPSTTHIMPLTQSFV